VSPRLPLTTLGAKVFAGRFSEGVPGSLPTGSVFLQSSADNFPQSVPSAGCASDRTGGLQASHT